MQTPLLTICETRKHNQHTQTNNHTKKHTHTHTHQQTGSKPKPCIHKRCRVGISQLVSVRTLGRRTPPTSSAWEATSALSLCLFRRNWGPTRLQDVCDRTCLAQRTLSLSALAQVDRRTTRHSAASPPLQRPATSAGEATYTFPFRHENARGGSRRCPRHVIPSARSTTAIGTPSCPRSGVVTASMLLSEPHAFHILTSAPSQMPLAILAPRCDC